MNEEQPGNAFDKWIIFLVIETQIFHIGQPSHGGNRTTFLLGIL